MNSITDAARGKSLTVDSKLQQEIYDLTVEAGKLREQLKESEASKAIWKFWAIVFGGYSTLLIAVVIYYKFL